MQRYFIDFDPHLKQITLSGEIYHHAIHVLRMKKGDKFYISNENNVFIVTITDIGQDELYCDLTEEVIEHKELPIKIVIAQGMPKMDKFEWIIQKTTELGVSELIPVLSERSLIKVDAKTATKKLERYQKIVKEAAEQSHRQKIPVVNAFMSFKEFLKVSHNYDIKLVAYEACSKQDELNFKQALHQIEQGQSLIVFIGPEGGIGDQELNLLKEHEFKVITLGNRILRTETAPLFVMSSVIYELELKG